MRAYKMKANLSHAWFNRGIAMVTPAEEQLQRLKASRAEEVARRDRCAHMHELQSTTTVVDKSELFLGGGLSRRGGSSTRLSSYRTLWMRGYGWWLRVTLVLARVVWRRMGAGTNRQLGQGLRRYHGHRKRRRGNFRC